MSKRLQRFKPKKSYLDTVNIESIKLHQPLTNQLLILDLNGTLVSRVRNNKSMYVRPYSQQFIDYVFDNFNVMLWSSAQPHSVNNMSRLFGKHREKLSLIWDRTSFGLSAADYNRKILTIKDLDKVWEHFKGQYNATNTILLDDSPKKAQLHPYNCIHPSEFEHGAPAFVSSGESELLHVLDYLKVLQLQSNVSNYMRKHPYHTLEKDTAQNSFETKFYLFADDYDKAGQIVDLQQRKKKSTTDVLITNMSNLKLQ
ncbi:HAD-like domain-containing protein [Parasitella parasitica]|nr:HAD-like domain-containing protein [Parasitella parasitica]